MMQSDSTSKFLVRAPQALHQALVRAAELRGVSANSLSVSILSTGLGLDISPSRSPGRLLQVGAKSGLIAELSDYITNSLVPAFGASLVGAVLFGSAARGAMRCSSDIDLLIILSRDGELDRDSYSCVPQIAINGHMVSPLLVKMIDQVEDIRSVWLEVALDGLVLFDTDLKVATLLARIRGEIANGCFRRQQVYGMPYWINARSNTIKTKGTA
jgi:hypothetical protein